MDRKIKEWIQNLDSCNQWIEHGPVRAYLRKMFRRGAVYTLDIVAIEGGGNGDARKLVRKIHGLNPWPVTYVENVAEPALRTWLEDDGWSEDGDSFFKTTTVRPKYTYTYAGSVPVCISMYF